MELIFIKYIKIKIKYNKIDKYVLFRIYTARQISGATTTRTEREIDLLHHNNTS